MEPIEDNRPTAPRLSAVQSVMTVALFRAAEEGDLDALIAGCVFVFVFGGERNLLLW
jgi:hypothetical protein